MKQEGIKSQMEQVCWAGLDWGTKENAVSVVSAAGQLLAHFKTGASLEEIKGLSERLRRFPKLAGVAVESMHEAVAGHLLEQGFTLYPVNPKLSKNWRDCNSVAGVKSDERDGHVLAMELARRHQDLRPLKRGDAAVEELAGLCRALRKLVSHRSALVQRLKATLRQYYRGGLDFFEDWTSPVAWRFLKRFPRPEVLAHTRETTLFRFLKANRIGLKPIWRERVEKRVQATQWPSPPDRLAMEVSALATAAELQALQPRIDELDRLIAERARELEEAKLLRTLPGAGERLDPALATIVVTALAEGEGFEGLRCISGAAPVEDKSGKRQRVRIRKRCNKHWRNTLHLFAKSSINWCPWARAFYDLHREKGDSYATALRKLAIKWLKISVSMLESGQPYDEARYVEALRKGTSPVYNRLCGKPCE